MCLLHLTYVSQALLEEDFFTSGGSSGRLPTAIPLRLYVQHPLETE